MSWWAGATGGCGAAPGWVVPLGRCERRGSIAALAPARSIKKARNCARSLRYAEIVLGEDPFSTAIKLRNWRISRSICSAGPSRIRVIRWAPTFIWGRADRQRARRASQAWSCGDRGSANSALAMRALPEQAIGAKNGQALRVRGSRAAVAGGLEDAVDGPVDGARSCPRWSRRSAQSSVLICSATRFVMPGVDAMSPTEASRMACSEPNLRSRAFLRVGPMPRMRSSGLSVTRCRRRRRW